MSVMLSANLGGGASAVQERWRVNSEVGRRRGGNSPSDQTRYERVSAKCRVCSGVTSSLAERCLQGYKGAAPLSMWRVAKDGEHARSRAANKGECMYS